MILNIFLSSLLVGTEARAADCVDQVHSTDKHTLQVLKMGERCMLSVWPRAVNSVRRKIQVNDRGMVMIQIDKPGGSSSRNTGARTYHVVPVSGNPVIVERSYFRDASGMEWQVRGVEWAPDACDVRATAPTLENQGGYEIRKCDERFVIDSGFMKGENPISNRERSSKIIASNGKTCSVKNNQIFEYRGSDATLKLKTNSDLRSFLRLIPSCAHLLDAVQPHSEPQDARKPTT